MTVCVLAHAALKRYPRSRAAVSDWADRHLEHIDLEGMSACVCARARVCVRASVCKCAYVKNIRNIAIPHLEQRHDGVDDILVQEVVHASVRVRHLQQL